MDQKFDSHQTRKGKVWVIGFDGATLALIKPWANQGSLPTFAHLLEAGVWGPLISPIPQSPPAWASFMTGKNPGKHGIYEFVQPRRDSYDVDLTNGSLLRAKTLWRFLSERGRKVGVVNVPMTFPPEEVNGFLISGFDTPYGNTEYTYPRELYETLQKRFGRYTFFPVIAGVSLRQMVENFQETIDLREKIMHFLLEEYALDFFVLVFNATDSTQHLCLQSYSDNGRNSAQLRALLSIYKRLDTFLADLLGNLPADTTLLIMSDHGAGPLKGYINLDHWLAAQGWLRYAEDNPETAAKQRRARLLGKGVKLAKSVVPGVIKRRLRQASGLRARIEAATTPPRLDWAHTQAHTCTSQGIYINLRGRQPQGMVEPGTEYETLRGRITEALLELRDPHDGEPVVAQVYKKEDFFSGPYLDLAPDLYIHWRDDAYLSWTDDSQPRDQFFYQPRPLAYEETVPENRITSVGCHQREGILFMYGKAVQAGHDFEKAQLVDLAPTVLALMGEPVPTDMDGRALTEALHEAYLTACPVRFAEEEEAETEADFAESAYSDEDEDQVRERLRELGYL